MLNSKPLLHGSESVVWRFKEDSGHLFHMKLLMAAFELCPII